MEKELLAKIVGVVLLVLIVANFLAFIFVKNPPWLFWTIIVVVALLAYFVVPRIRSNEKTKIKKN
ncbi:MAG: hypothetical protein KAT77_04595 [Nanoarchaeota archaeon]|nr:hypothetical protein [Nanoarchaeota archaeon]